MAQQLFTKLDQQMLTKIGQKLFKKIGQQMLMKIGQQMLTKIGQQLFHTIETDNRLAGANQHMFLSHTIDSLLSRLTDSFVFQAALIPLLFCKLEHIKLGNLCFVTIEVCCHPLTMISSVMYQRFIHITLEIPQSIAAFLLAQTHGDSPLDSWEFQYGKKFHSQF